MKIEVLANSAVIGMTTTGNFDLLCSLMMFEYLLTIVFKVSPSSIICCKQYSLKSSLLKKLPKFSRLTLWWH